MPSRVLPPFWYRIAYHPGGGVLMSHCPRVWVHTSQRRVLSMQDRSQRRVLPHSFLGSQEPETSATSIQVLGSQEPETITLSIHFWVHRSQRRVFPHSVLGSQEPETSAPNYVRCCSSMLQFRCSTIRSHFGSSRLVKVAGQVLKATLGKR